MASKTIPIKICRGAGSSFLGCVGTIKETEFYDSFNKLEGNKVCYCMKCCDKIFNYYKDNGYDIKSSLYYTLQKIDVPFIQDIYDKLESKGKVSVKNYLSEIQGRKDKTEVWNDFSSSDKISESTADEKEKQKERLEHLEEVWGIQDMEKDYEFLENTFDRYTKGVDFINQQQKDLYKDLCRDRLLLRKINDGRYGGEETIDKVQNRIGKTMSTLKVDQFESNKPKTLSEQSLFTKIAQVEMTKPCELYKEPRKYKDFNKIKKYYKDLVLRPLLNTLAGHRDFEIDIDDISRYNIEDNNEEQSWRIISNKR